MCTCVASSTLQMGVASYNRAHMLGVVRKLTSSDLASLGWICVAEQRCTDAALGARRIYACSSSLIDLHFAFVVDHAQMGLGSQGQLPRTTSRLHRRHTRGAVAPRYSRGTRRELIGN
jgi:hypothetical protein